MTSDAGALAVGVSCPDAATPDAAASSGIGAGHMSGHMSGQPFDLHHFRRVFPDRWMAFLHAHFRDHIQVAYMFGVSERAARKWWEGCGAPSAPFALAACKHIPGALDALLEAA